MPVYNTGSSGSPILSDPAYADVRRQLGLGTTRRQVIPDSTPALGQTFLRQPENVGALASLLATQLQGEGQPLLARVLTQRLGDVVNRYKAALALNPQLQPDEFLGQFDVARFADNYSPYERGERPYAYLRGFKLLGG
jgi:hypothetical protein